MCKSLCQTIIGGQTIVRSCQNFFNKDLYYGGIEQREESNPYKHIIMDHIGPLIATQALLWKGYNNHSELSIFWQL
ncbi:hypothetical protein CR513_49031, partial [Mucuna pruriens]